MTKKIQVINDDAIKVLASQPCESVDLIVADPPYNLGKDYGNLSDSQSETDYLNFSERWIQEAYRSLKSSGTIYVFMGFRYISHIYQILEKSGFHFSNWITWHYTQGIGKTKGFSPRHDDILMFTKTKSFKFNLDDIRIPQKYYRSVNNMRGANPGDVWEFSHVHYCQENRQPHPTQKPEGVIERMVLASSDVNDLVIDPFCGSGTSLRVCQQLQRRAIGIEINPEFVVSINARLQEPFDGFDSIDPRMERIPNDLNNPLLRARYIKDHISWFLKNHEPSINKFLESVKEKYPDDYSVSKLKAKKNRHQMYLELEQIGT